MSIVHNFLVTSNIRRKYPGVATDFYGADADRPFHHNKAATMPANTPTTKPSDFRIVPAFGAPEPVLLAAGEDGDPDAPEVAAPEFAGPDRVVDAPDAPGAPVAALDAPAEPVAADDAAPLAAELTDEMAEDKDEAIELAALVLHREGQPHVQY